MINVNQDRSVQLATLFLLVHRYQSEYIIAINVKSMSICRTTHQAWEFSIVFHLFGKCFEVAARNNRDSCNEGLLM